MASYTPSTRPEHIDALISGVDRYNPHNLPLLHDYLESQLKGEYDWDCMAGLAILKLYQFNPTTFTYPLVISMLAKSMHALPSPDFNLLLSLLGEAPVAILPQKGIDSTDPAATSSEDPASTTSANAATSNETTAPATPSVPSAGILTDATIIKLHDLATLLTSSRYPTFWTTLASSEYSEVRSEVLENVADFENGVRKVVLQGTSRAFKSISKARLARYLGLKEDEVESSLSSLADGWEIKSDGVIEIPDNKDNVVKPAGLTREEVGLGDLNRLLQQAAPSSVKA